MEPIEKNISPPLEMINKIYLLWTTDQAQWIILTLTVVFSIYKITIALSPLRNRGSEILLACAISFAGWIFILNIFILDMTFIPNKTSILVLFLFTATAFIMCTLFLVSINSNANISIPLWASRMILSSFLATIIIFSILTFVKKGEEEELLSSLMGLALGIILSLSHYGLQRIRIDETNRNWRGPKL